MTAKVTEIHGRDSTVIEVLVVRDDGSTTVEYFDSLNDAADTIEALPTERIEYEEMNV
jgi:hypothetical protein